MGDIILALNHLLDINSKHNLYIKSELGSYTQESKQPICLSMTDIKQMVIETINEIYKKGNL